MSETLLAIVFAIFIWWFSTGIVILLNRMSRNAISVSLLISSLLCVAALFGLMRTSRQIDIASTYCAFTCALLAWGWNELSFLTGWITGPRKSAISREVTGRLRFVESCRAVIWHELGILFIGVAIIAISWNAPNQVGTGTYLVLWIMRTSAKLNLFLGVRNLSEEFLPPHLAYLQSFFRRRAMNWFFPLSVSAAIACLAILVSKTLVADQVAIALGHTLIGTMLALAIVEHLLLVLPVDTTALWRWAIRNNGKGGAKSLDIGKTGPSSKSSPAYFASKSPVAEGQILDPHDKFFQVR